MKNKTKNSSQKSIKKSSKKNKKKLIEVRTSKKKTVRLVDIAKRVGVAVSTVSRILNGTPNNVKLTEETKKKVFAVASELGYASFHIPVKYHQGMRSVMVISYDPGEIFYQKIISAIEQTVRAKGYACYFSYTEGDPRQASELIDAMSERFTSGCVIFQNKNEVFTPKNKLKLQNLNIPCVVVDQHPIPKPDFISTVQLDNEKAGYDLASHLLRLGHRNFAFLSIEKSSSCPERKKGLEKRLAQAGLELDPTFVADVDVDARFKLFDIFKSWISGKKPFPTAIVTVHDLIGYAVLNVLENMGFKIPEDISIASFDDRVEMVPWVYDNIKIPLTSIRQPIEAIGKAVGEELIARIIDSKRKPEHIRLKGELIIRSSTAKPRQSLKP